jgi:hypothetical protein
MAGYKEFHRRSIDDREGFWREQAQLIEWHKPFDRGPRLFKAAVLALGMSAARPTSAITRSTGI